jgi:hypothetical protein
MEAMRSSETSVDTRSTQLYIPEGGILDKTGVIIFILAMSKTSVSVQIVEIKQRLSWSVLGRVTALDHRLTWVYHFRGGRGNVVSIVISVRVWDSIPDRGRDFSVW